MKLTKKLVRDFEEEQKNHGTETALFNLIWLIADELLTGIGIKRLHTSEKARGKERVVYDRKGLARQR